MEILPTSLPDLSKPPKKTSGTNMLGIKALKSGGKIPTIGF